MPPTNQIATMVRSLRRFGLRRQAAIQPVLDGLSDQQKKTGDLLAESRQTFNAADAMAISVNIAIKSLDEFVRYADRGAVDWRGAGRSGLPRPGPQTVQRPARFGAGHAMMPNDDAINPVRNPVTV